jgi:hypothetical protein
MRGHVCRALVGALFAMVAACGSHHRGTGDGGIGDGNLGDTTPYPPCALLPNDPHCNQSCTTDEECGANLYCGNEHVCRADCTLGGGECSAGYSCVGHGRCESGCPSVKVDATPTVPTIVLLIDQSGSMTTDFGSMSRWEAVRYALTDPTHGVLPALESSVWFGASLYTSHNGNAGGTCPILKEVAPALNNRSAIASLLNANQPDGDTPTGESIDAVVATLLALPARADEGMRAIVLATDGEPDTCEVPNPQQGQGRSVQAAQAAYAAGIHLYILSVGSDVGATHLQDMANAGVGLPVGGATNAPYYVADNPADMTAAFGQIIGVVRSCTLSLSAAVQGGYECSGDVRLGGVPLVCNDPNGYRLTDPTTLELLGDACQSFLDNPQTTLDATFPCGSIIL